MNVIECLEARVEEAEDFLSIPDRFKKEDGTENPVSICSLWYVKDALKGLKEAYPHSLRLGLYSIAVGSFLGFETPSLTFQQFFAAAISHDLGKYCAIDCEGKSQHFSQQDMKRMREHPILSSQLNFFDDEVVLGIVERHHLWQKRPYPTTHELKTGTSQEIEYLSKLLAILDFHDASSTRINSRTIIPVFSRIMGANSLPSKRQVRKQLLVEYGDLTLTYDSNLLPQIDCKGSALIPLLYDTGIFGRKNPLNPFQEPGSFVFNTS